MGTGVLGVSADPSWRVEQAQALVVADGVDVEVDFGCHLFNREFPGSGVHTRIVGVNAHRVDARVESTSNRLLVSTGASAHEKMRAWISAGLLTTSHVQPTSTRLSASSPTSGRTAQTHQHGHPSTSRSLHTPSSSPSVDWTSSAAPTPAMARMRWRALLKRDTDTIAVDPADFGNIAR